MSADNSTFSPLIRQYLDIKKDYPHALLLFQVGDFYELFFEDAQKAAHCLGIALAKRGFHANEPIPLCGVPVHTLDHYIIKLVKSGFRVVICEQKSTSQTGKIIERVVTQVLTPGTLTDVKLLNEKSASYIAVLFPTKQSYGIACAELLTGQIFVTSIAVGQERLLEAELSRFSPDELVLPDTKLGLNLEYFLKKLGYLITMHPYVAEANNSDAQAWLDQHLSDHARAFVQRSQSVSAALEVMYNYFALNQPHALSHFKQLFVYSPEDFLLLDAATQRNLELVKNSYDSESDHTLFSVIDQAATAMGSRLLKKWLLRPLVKKDALEQRLDVVQLLVEEARIREKISAFLRDIGDLERVIGRIALRRAQVHDYSMLGRALNLVPSILSILRQLPQRHLLEVIISKVGNFDLIAQELSSALQDDVTQELRIKRGFNAEFDRLLDLTTQGTQAVLELERKEQISTGINSLKIRYNKIHGYGIEITKTHLSSVPARYMRLQTLVNRERFATQELKDLEYDLNRAHADTQDMEKELFEKLCRSVEPFVHQLKKLTQAFAHIDALLSLAQVACSYRYVRPQFNDAREIVIVDGRHPVVELQLQHNFIPNTTSLTDAETLWIITGPNMGGKSTYLRQVALTCIMAQMGSFVPAQSAHLPILDRIFTRIGSGDAIAHGKSTFLVEMEETALICNHATNKSLVILDEVGRGTSTYDGLAIAQAVVEHIYSVIKARCLFATHYHELTMLADISTGIAAYHMASKRTENGIVLLRKIVPGASDGSFGIEIARQANLPESIIMRSQAIIEQLHRVEQA
jgi:DNA mismatch repair protein MutS